MIDLKHTSQPYERNLPAVTTVAGVTGYQAMVGSSASPTSPDGVLPIPGGSTMGAGLGASGDIDAGTGIVDRVYYSSWKGMMARNLGRDVVVSFLLGTQNTVVARGTLYEVGSDYIALYQKERQSYITADLYAIKFLEFLPEIVEGQERPTAPQDAVDGAPPNAQEAQGDGGRA